VDRAGGTSPRRIVDSIGSGSFSAWSKPVIRRERIAEHGPGYEATRANVAKAAEAARGKLVDLSETMRAGMLRLESDAELSRANALLPSTQLAVSTASLPELASALLAAAYAEDRPLLYVLAHVIPPRLAGLRDDALSQNDLAAANDLRAMLGKVRSELQDRRGLAHVERARELRNRVESLRRKTGVRERAPFVGENDVSWG
jgi:hypothetical protein